MRRKLSYGTGGVKIFNPKTSLLLALVGILVGHYAYLHDLLFGGTVIMMGQRHGLYPRLA
jgi:hypothetical protein